jgi:hypothetical protein
MEATDAAPLAPTRQLAEKGVVRRLRHQRVLYDVQEDGCADEHGFLPAPKQYSKVKHV